MLGEIKPLNVTCNGAIFFYEGMEEFLIVFICIASLVLLFLLYKMLRLCSIAFSYSNFHVHETYKLYALAIVNVAVVLLSRKAQYDYRQLLLKGEKDDTIE
jgi:hypothetical protein